MDYIIKTDTKRLYNQRTVWGYLHIISTQIYRLPARQGELSLKRSQNRASRTVYRTTGWNGSVTPFPHLNTHLDIFAIKKYFFISTRPSVTGCQKCWLGKKNRKRSIEARSKHSGGGRHPRWNRLAWPCQRVRAYGVCTHGPDRQTSRPY